MAHRQNLICNFTPVLLCQFSKGLCYNKGSPDSAALWVVTSGHESAAPRHLSLTHACLNYISAANALRGLFLLNAVGAVILKVLMVRHGNLRSNLFRKLLCLPRCLGWTLQASAANHIYLRVLRFVKREKSGSKPHEHGNRHERDQFRLSKIPLVDLSMALAFTPPHSPTPVVGHLSQDLD